MLLGSLCCFLSLLGSFCQALAVRHSPCWVIRYFPCYYLTLIGSHADMLLGFLSLGL